MLFLKIYNAVFFILFFIFSVFIFIKFFKMSFLIRLSAIKVHNAAFETMFW